MLMAVSVWKIVLSHVPLDGVISEKTGQGSPSLIRGGIERSLWQQNSTRCCAVRERFTLLFDR
jgi:hypothetical protein